MKQFQVLGAGLVVLAGGLLIFGASHNFPVSTKWTFVPVELGTALIGLGLYMFEKIN